LNPNPTKFGDKDPTTVACRQKMTTLKKWLIKYFNPNIPSNDPSDLEYSWK
jgi:hypothetical protein